MKTICFVEDEKHLIDLMRNYLEKEGYKVITCFSGEEAINVKEKVDLWILDIMLSGNLSGYDIIKKIREEDKVVPVIFTSARDTTLDKEIGLELDADEYITKPYSPKELVLRVNKLFKRIYSNDFDIVKISEYKIDIKKRVVFFQDKEIKLTSLEFDLLEIFVSNIGYSLIRDIILIK